ncbi:MAG: DUF5714 domain-containing protein [Dehalococcoidia bacterium]
MNKSGMKEEAKKAYFWDDYHAITNKIKGVSDKDLDNLAPAIRQFILTSSEKDPIRMFYSVFDEIKRIWSLDVPFPIGGSFHHYILPGVILSCLRNNGYEITDREIEEGMKRGAMLAAHSCGFTGISGAAHGVGIVASMVNRITPMHDERGGILAVAADTLMEISKFQRRCCKRSNFTGIKNAVEYLWSKGYTLPLDEVERKFFSGNAECSGEECPYYLKQAGDDMTMVKGHRLPKEE